MRVRKGWTLSWAWPPPVVEMASDASKDIWLLTKASERAKAEIEALGFRVIEDGYKEVLASGEDMEFDELPADWQDKT